MRCSTECGCCNYGPSPSSGSAGWLGCAMNIRPAHACKRCRCRVLNASASAATHNHPHPSPRFGMTALFCLRLLILVIAVATQPYPDSVSGSNGEENSFRVDIDSASFRAVPLHEDKDFSCPSPPHRTKMFTSCTSPLQPMRQFILFDLFFSQRSNTRASPGTMGRPFACLLTPSRRFVLYQVSFRFHVHLLRAAATEASSARCMSIQPVVRLGPDELSHVRPAAVPARCL